MDTIHCHRVFTTVATVCEKHTHIPNRIPKRKGMWDDLLIVFSADNGGPIYNNGSAGANNYPLKGGKMNNWEGKQTSRLAS